VYREAQGSSPAPSWPGEAVALGARRKVPVDVLSERSLPELPVLEAQLQGHVAQVPTGSCTPALATGMPSPFPELATLFCFDLPFPRYGLGCPD